MERSKQQQPRSLPCSVFSWEVGTKLRRALRCCGPSSPPSWLTAVPASRPARVWVLKEWVMTVTVQKNDAASCCDMLLPRSWPCTLGTFLYKGQVIHSPEPNHGTTTFLFVFKRTELLVESCSVAVSSLSVSLLFSQCVRALGMCCYVSAAEEGEVRTSLSHVDQFNSPSVGFAHRILSLNTESFQDLVKSLNLLENVFMASYPNKDGALPAPKPGNPALHSAALQAWSLLVTLCPASKLRVLLDLWVGNKTCHRTN